MSLLNRWIDIYYYRMRRDLNQLYIPNLTKRSFNPKHFLINLFDSSLNKVIEKHIFIRYLNQISGPTLEGWKLQPSTEVVEGTKYNQCRMGPDQWLQRAPIFKEYERSVQLSDTRFSDWKTHEHYYYTICNDDVGIVLGSRHLSQFHGGSVLVTYSLWQKMYRRYTWMPLPSLQLDQQEFEFIRIKQKRKNDEMFMEECNLMDSIIFLQYDVGNDHGKWLCIICCITMIERWNDIFYKKMHDVYCTNCSPMEMHAIRTKNHQFPVKMFRIEYLSL